MYTQACVGREAIRGDVDERGGAQGDSNKLIHVGEPIEMDDELFEKQLEMLEKACTSEAKDIKQIVASVVKTYHPDTED